MENCSYTFCKNLVLFYDTANGSTWETGIHLFCYFIKKGQRVNLFPVHINYFLTELNWGLLRALTHLYYP